MPDPEVTFGAIPGLDDGEIGAKLGEGLRSFFDNNWPILRDQIVEFFDEKQARGKFTEAVVNKMWEHAGQEYVAGYVITDVDYTVDGAIWGTEMYYQGKFWDWKYTLLAFPNDRESSFTRHGDGGYLNWSFTGYCTRDGENLYFYETPYSKNKKEEEREREAEEEREREKEAEEKQEEHDRKDDDFRRKHHGHTSQW